jgi:hypothetical protein
VTGAACEHRETAHEGAADAEDVDVHKAVVPRRRFGVRWMCATAV